MCSGKTTLGRALASALGCEFIDLDHYIEDKTGMKVREIFNTKGEDAFRRMELQALDAICNNVDIVVACGGGTPCIPNAMDMMNAKGTTVWLQPRPDRLLQRLMHGKHKRPLIANIETEEEMMAFAKSKIDERRPYYAQSKYIFDSSWLENGEQIENTIARFKSEIAFD